MKFHIERLHPMRVFEVGITIVRKDWIECDCIFFRATLYSTEAFNEIYKDMYYDMY